jgi:hypothetical protein
MCSVFHGLDLHGLCVDALVQRATLALFIEWHVEFQWNFTSILHAHKFYGLYYLLSAASYDMYTSSDSKQTQPNAPACIYHAVTISDGEYSSATILSCYSI